MPTINPYLNFQGNIEEAERIFNELSAGGEIELDMQGAFWGDYFGMFTDKFGVKWMVSFNQG